MVKQRSKSDCAIAAVANAAGVSYAKVKRCCGHVKDGLELHELRWLLSMFGEWKERRTRKDIAFKDWLAKHPSGRWVVEVPAFLDSHVVAVVDGKLLGDANENRTIGRTWELQNQEVKT